MKEGKDGSGPRPTAIGDPRFARLHTDPRFQRMPKDKTKVSIDSRFAHMFTDKNFSDPVGVDKRGRAKKKKEKHLLQRYYKVDEDDAEGEERDGEKKDRNGVKRVKQTDHLKGMNGVGDKGRSRVLKKGIKGKIEQELSLDETPGGRALPKYENELHESGKLGQAFVVDSKDGKAKVKPKSGYLKVSKLVTEVKSDDEAERDESGEDINLNSSESDKGVEGEKEINLQSDESDEEVEREKNSHKTLTSARHEEDPSSDDEDISDPGVDSDAEISSSSSSSESEAESDREEEIAEESEKVPTTSDETRRFAMMNMDWEHIKAVDLLMLMRSFLPKGGHVKSVTVYPSEYGIELMKAEEVHGPTAVFDNEEEEEEDEKEIDMEKLRAYEKNKLKYYYAVVECDSKATANHLYRQCDGMEFERTSNTLDLRFIPDEMKFERPPRDVAKDIPNEYKAPEFETRALQHSNVKLTWDDDEPTRVKALRRKFNADQLNEMDFRTYLASESEDDEGEEADNAEEEVSGSGMGDAPSDPKEGKSTEARDKYRSLLLGDSTEDPTAGKKSGKGDVDMEVTFHTGLSELSEKLLQKQEAQERGDETVWEAYLRKKKEKKLQKKKSKNAKNSDDEESEDEMESPRGGPTEADPFFTHDEKGFDDPFFASDGEAPKERKKVQKSGKMERSGDAERAKKREEKEQKKKDVERSKAELELLLMDDIGVQAVARGFNLKSKKEKKKKEKGKSKKIKGGDKNEEDDKLATANLDDPRFESLFSNHHFAIDPTNPQFRKSSAQLKILAEAQRRRQQNSEGGVDSRPEVVEVDSPNIDKIDRNGDASMIVHPDRKRKAELSLLVKSLKRKVGSKTKEGSKAKKS